MPYVRQATEFPVIYAYGPDSSPQPGVPSGFIHEHAWNESSIFPGTTRRYWLYVPAYMSSEPAPLMVFQDGWLYLDPDGAYRVGVVMDNLIHRGEMPATVGVFVDPGEPDNRNAEYDSFDDVYATFLLTEILSPVLHSLNITEDPEIGRIYSGTVRRVVPFGAFVEISPGKDGLVHISELEPHRVERVEDVINEGDTVLVKVIGIDREGKIKLSRKQALPGYVDTGEPAATGGGRSGGDRGDRGPRRRPEHSRR